MATACNFARSRLSFNPSARGYLIIYRAGETNHCPGCGRTSWLVGRTSAECAFCATAIPLADQDRRPAAAPTFWKRGN
jgi:hypothetical protein